MLEAIKEKWSKYKIMPVIAQAVKETDSFLWTSRVTFNILQNVQNRSKVNLQSKQITGIYPTKFGSGILILIRSGTGTGSAFCYPKAACLSSKYTVAQDPIQIILVKKTGHGFINKGLMGILIFLYSIIFLSATLLNIAV